MPPNRKKNSAAAPYMMPIFLWSTVVTQLRQPVVSPGRAKTPMGRSFATVARSEGEGCVDGAHDVLVPTAG